MTGFVQFDQAIFMNSARNINSHQMVHLSVCNQRDISDDVTNDGEFLVLLEKLATAVFSMEVIV